MKIKYQVLKHLDKLSYSSPACRSEESVAGSLLIRLVNDISHTYYTICTSAIQGVYIEIHFSVPFSLLIKLENQKGMLILT